MKNISIYSFLVILLALVGIGFFEDMTNSLIKVEASNSCFVKNIGTTDDGNKIRNIYSYCLDDVKLDKVLLDDKTVSYSKLIQNLKKDECLWDGGTCEYNGNDYKIISCQTVMGDGDIIITTKDVEFNYIYDEFCSNVETE